MRGFLREEFLFFSILQSSHLGNPDYPIHTFLGVTLMHISVFKALNLLFVQKHI